MSSVDKSPAARTAVASTPAVATPGPLQQSLFPIADGRDSSARRPELPRPRPARQLWLCIHLPQLPLEALPALSPSAARAVFEEQQGIRRILLANEAAASTGIEAGQPVNAALSLLPELELAERSPELEARTLHRLAAWAEQFTSFVSIEAPATLLLEVAGSLRLFAGLTALRRDIVSGLRGHRLTAQLAVAPAPLAATWLAWAGRNASIGEPARLAGLLGSLPLGCLDWPDAVVESLRGMGVTRVGDCLRLPRQGFARRFGARRLDELDRALGKCPDPRDHYRAPERFNDACDLEAEQDDRELLLQVCRELLQKLERFLLTRQVGIQRLRFSFFHLDAPATHLVLGSVQGGRSVAHWCDLLRIKFDRLSLPAPVISVQLRGGEGQGMSAGTDRLAFTGAPAPREAEIGPLIERLSTRIGNTAVHGVTTVADHRPQHAWRPVGALDDVPRCATAATRYWNEREMPQLLQDLRLGSSLLLRRPLWMLEEPEQLPMRQGEPVYHGPLTLLDGPERLESGWWDESGIARDYYIAKSAKGVHLWIYRDRGSHGAWYLHGVFG